MSQLGATSPLRHIRGFFYPVKEKPEIQAALEELEAAEVDRVETQHQLTD
jgi:ubiquinol-cytochrome c reductase cytochrome b subunit